MAERVFSTILSRPDPATKLGLRLSSTSERDPPVICALSGVSTNSDLEIGDIILGVDGKDVKNSVMAQMLLRRSA